MSNTMWGGRFNESPDAVLQEINASIDFDRKLYVQDITGSMAHMIMLEAKGIVSSEDAQQVLHGLDTILQEIETGKFTFSRELEDIHMNIEARLTEIIGAAAGRLHTARSRNDQVATDLKLWVRDVIDIIDRQLHGLMVALTQQAEKHPHVAMPGFTHLQIAQPVTFGHHMLAYVEMFARDRGRFADARKRLNECPLGAAALAGTSFPIDRDMTARALSFDRPTANSLDSVSDRDFALESMAAASICATHMSRMAEEIVLWCSAGFRFIKLSDKFTTGSSIMPQKRNPDAAELVRAKTGRINGSLMALLTVMKGLPLAYSKDMQEDKEQVFDALESLTVCLAAMTGMVADMEPDVATMRNAASARTGYATATDLADWLVRVIGMPFREAHHVTGRIVALAEEKGVQLHKLPIEQMKAVDSRITEEVIKVLTIGASTNSRTSFGGTAPANVRKAARKWMQALEGEFQTGAAPKSGPAGRRKPTAAGAGGRGAPTKQARVAKDPPIEEKND